MHMELIPFTMQRKSVRTSIMFFCVNCDNKLRIKHGNYFTNKVRQVNYGVSQKVHLGFS